MRADYKERSLFWRIFFIVLIVCIIIAAGMVFMLRSQLAEYEQNRPERIAESVFVNSFKNSNPDGIAHKIAPDDITDEEMKALVREIGNAIASGELSYKETDNGGSTYLKKYLVSAGDRDIASFTLNKKEDTEKDVLIGLLGLSYSNYTTGVFKSEMGKINTDAPGTCTVVITAPTGYTVKVDGNILGEESVIESDIPYEAVRYVPDGLAQITGKKYRYVANTAEPTVSCLSPSAIGSEITVDPETGEYTAALVYDSYISSKFEQPALDAAETFARFLTNDATFDELAIYLYKSSRLFEQTRSTNTSFVTEHDGCEFRDESVSEYIVWSSDIFSCRVKLTQVLHRAGAEDTVQTIDKVYFFRTEGTNTYIFDNYNMN